MSDLKPGDFIAGEYSIQRVLVDVFVTRHLLLKNIVLQLGLDISFGSRHDAVMKILFLQPR